MIISEINVLNAHLSNMRMIRFFFIYNPALFTTISQRETLLKDFIIRVFYFDLRSSVQLSEAH